MKKTSIDALGKSIEATAAWKHALDQLLSSSALTSSANRAGLETELNDAGALFNAAGAALWRFASTGAPKDEVGQRTEGAIDTLKRARARRRQADRGRDRSIGRGGRPLQILR